jgi:hypothetical protein
MPKSPADGTVRVDVDLSVNLYLKLEELAQKLGISRIDVLRHGIALMDVAVDAKKNSLRVGVADSSGQLLKEIVSL